MYDLVFLQGSPACILQRKKFYRDRGAAMQFYKNMYGLVFTSIEPNDQGQRILGNATFVPGRSVFDLTYAFNSCLLSGRSRTKCFPAQGGGFRVCFSGPMMLHREYGEEGKSVSEQTKILCMNMTMFLMLISNRNFSYI